VPHTVSREEILFVLSGSLRITLGQGGQGSRAEAASTTRPGDAILVPAGSTLRVDNPATMRPRPG
jgi:mannose-6-phosphate isomerase-like protein (cupin superfamily)